MKNWQIFGIGFLAGIGATILVLFLIGLGLSNNGSGDLTGATMFENPGDAVPERSFKVLQVVDDNAALVKGKDNDLFDTYMGPVYLIVNSEGKFYYDDEIINIPKGKNARQVGIYKYSAKSGIDKTVAIIEIME